MMECCTHVRDERYYNLNSCFRQERNRLESIHRLFEPATFRSGVKVAEEKITYIDQNQGLDADQPTGTLCSSMTSSLDAQLFGIGFDV
jgi:hypothetical protein